MRPALYLTSALILALTAGCSRGGSGQAAGIPERSTLPVDDVTGLSGIALGDGEVLWLVAERDRVLLRRAADGSITRMRIQGVEPGYDVESVAYLGEGSFAFGIERNTGAQDAGSTALLLLAKLEAGVVEITETIELDTGLWGLTLRDNEGVEGLCRAGELLVAGVETVGGGSDGEPRFAPIGVYDLAARSWKAYQLRLSSLEGSLSAIACELRDGRVEIIGIERYFGVLRILRARLPKESGEVVPEILFNLDSFADATKLNIEGVVVGKGADLIMVVDNHYRGVNGPNELVIVKGGAR